MTTDRDRAILAELNADKIEQLRATKAAIAKLDLPWRDAFEAEAVRLKAEGDRQPPNSEAAQECYGWSFAHTYLLETE